MTPLRVTSHKYSGMQPTYNLSPPSNWQAISPSLLTSSTPWIGCRKQPVKLYGQERVSVDYETTESILLHATLMTLIKQIGIRVEDAVTAIFNTILKYHQLEKSASKRIERLGSCILSVCWCNSGRTENNLPTGTHLITVSNESYNLWVLHR